MAQINREPGESNKPSENKMQTHYHYRDRYYSKHHGHDSFTCYPEPLLYIQREQDQRQRQAYTYILNRSLDTSETFRNDPQITENNTCYVAHQNNSHFIDYRYSVIKPYNHSRKQQEK